METKKKSFTLVVLVLLLLTFCCVVGWVVATAATLPSLHHLAATAVAATSQPSLPMPTAVSTGAVPITTPGIEATVSIMAASQPASSPTPTVMPTSAATDYSIAPGWNRIDYSSLPSPAGYPGLYRTIGYDRVPTDKEQPFDLTLYDSQVALFQGIRFDALKADGGPDIYQCYVALIQGPINWVRGELVIANSAVDWHQVGVGFDPLGWLSQKVQDVSAAYGAKDPNCNLEELQIWLYIPPATTTP